MKITACSVIKIGGKLLDHPEKIRAVCHRLAGWPQPFVVVHGGGKLAGELCRRLAIPERMVDGRRITDEQTLQVAVMTFAGWVNKSLVSALQREGVNACGLSGCDMQVVTARKRISPELDWGYVGDIESVKGEVLTALMAQRVVPVLSPITGGIDGVVLNTNADSVAAAVAEELAKTMPVELVYCFDKRGVLSDITKEDSVIPVLTRPMYEQGVREKQFVAGMLPKLANAFKSLDAGVRAVRLIHPGELGDPDAGTRICEK